MFLGLDDGLVSGYNDLADVFFLSAMILFVIVMFLRLLAVPRELGGVAVAAAAALLSLGWLVL